jgi:hypothetical protein
MTTTDGWRSKEIGDSEPSPLRPQYDCRLGSGVVLRCYREVFDGEPVWVSDGAVVRGVVAWRSVTEHPDRPK